MIFNNYSPKTQTRHQKGRFCVEKISLIISLFRVRNGAHYKPPKIPYIFHQNKVFPNVTATTVGVHNFTKFQRCAWKKHKLFKRDFGIYKCSSLQMQYNSNKTRADTFNPYILFKVIFYNLVIKLKILLQHIHFSLTNSPK